MASAFKAFIALFLCFAAAAPGPAPHLAVFPSKHIERRQTPAVGTPKPGTPSSGPHTLPPLPFGLGALAPYISEEMMSIHYNQHHSSYVKNLNTAIQTLVMGNLTNLYSTQSSLQYNAGGHINHSLLWLNLAPANSTAAALPGAKQTKLARDISVQWGSLEGFWEALKKKAEGVSGSGWIWLVKDPEEGLAIVTTRDQDPIVAPFVPIIGIDIWEHSYYIQYKSDRVAYLTAIYKVINWEEASRRYDGIVKPVVFQGWKMLRS